MENDKKGLFDRGVDWIRSTYHEHEKKVAFAGGTAVGFYAKPLYRAVANKVGSGSSSKNLIPGRGGKYIKI